SPDHRTVDIEAAKVAETGERIDLSLGLSCPWHYPQLMASTMPPRPARSAGPMPASAAQAIARQKIVAAAVQGSWTGNRSPVSWKRSTRTVYHSRGSPAR